MEMNAEHCREERAEGSDVFVRLETADGECVKFVNRDLVLQNWQEQLDETFAYVICVYSPKQFECCRDGGYRMLASM